MKRLLTPYRSNVLLVALSIAVLPPLTGYAMPSLFPGSLAVSLGIGAALAIAALSLNLLLGYAGQISLGHAAFIGVGAFSASVIVDRLNWSLLVGFPVGAAVGAVVALLIGLPALRLRGLFLALVTMVFGLTFQASVFRWKIFTRGSAGVAIPRRFLGTEPVTDNAIFLSVILLLLLIVWLFDRNVIRTKLGRAFRVIREDESVAQAFAVDVTRYKLLAFALSGAFAGLAGAAYGAALGFVNSDAFPLELSLRIVAFVIIGGLGRRWGVAVVAVLFSLNLKLPEFLRGYEFILAALVLLYNVVRLPEGLAGLVSALRVHAVARTMPRRDETLVSLVPKFPVPNSSGRSDEATVDEGALLSVEGASVHFDGLRAVDDVSLSVGRGTIVGLIGPNGAGKTTLFNAITGLAPSFGGRIIFDGAQIQNAPAHARAGAGIGRTFQLVGLAKDMTVKENMLLAQHRYASYGDVSALFYSRQVARIEDRLEALAGDVIGGLNFGRFADVPVRQLSIGQQRLVEIAAVLASDPKMLMLDEPSAGLAPAAAENLAERLADLRDEYGRTLFLIEHNVPLVLDVCDYVYVMNAGRLLAEGTPAALGQKPEILSAYLGEIGQKASLARA